MEDPPVEPLDNLVNEERQTLGPEDISYSTYSNRKKKYKNDKRFRNTQHYGDETPPVKRIERNMKLKSMPGRLNSVFLKKLEAKIKGETMMTMSMPLKKPEVEP